MITIDVYMWNEQTNDHKKVEITTDELRQLACRKAEGMYEAGYWNVIRANASDGIQITIKLTKQYREMKEIIGFLERNGYAKEYQDDEFIRYSKEGVCSVDIGEDEIVLVGDKGDFLRLPLNRYALIGALMDLRQIAVNYTP